MPDMVKSCNECGQEKPLNEENFYRHPGGLFGFHGRCKECVKKGASRHSRKRVKAPAVRRKVKETTTSRQRAWGRIKTLVSSGVLPHPNTLPCTDCGKRHEGEPTRRNRHEYDHYLGYEPPNDEKVQAVCVKCHKKREAARQEATSETTW
jgi:hypothetical protein